MRFYFTFSNNDNYAIAPLATFVIDSDQCTFMFRKLDNANGDVESDNVVLGAFFLQQYKVLWDFTSTGYHNVTL